MTRSKYSMWERSSYSSCAREGKGCGVTYCPSVGLYVKGSSSLGGLLVSDVDECEDAGLEFRY